MEPDVTSAPENMQKRLAQYDSILNCLRYAFDASDISRYRSDLDRWWQGHEESRELATPDLRKRIMSTSLHHAQCCMDSGRSDAAAWVLTALAAQLTDHADQLHCRAILAETEQDWDAAAMNWQLYAALQNPVATKSGSIFPENPEMRMQNMTYAFAALRMARIRQAQAHFAKGRMRAFRELVVRVIESLPDHRELASNPDCLELARHYVQDALQTGTVAPLPLPRSPDKILSRLVLCLDIWGRAEDHAPGRMALDLCARLLAHDPSLRIDLVVTHERLVTTTPLVADPADPFPVRDIPVQIQAALGASAAPRLQLHLPPETGIAGTGLEGVVRCAAAILSLQPDLVLHITGPDNPDMPVSRLMRHVLFDHVATAIQTPAPGQMPDQRCDGLLPAAAGHDPDATGKLHVALETAFSAGRERLSALRAPQDPVSQAKADR